MIPYIIHRFLYSIYDDKLFERSICQGATRGAIQIYHHEVLF